jgi:hypothetical protein
LTEKVLEETGLRRSSCAAMTRQAQLNRLVARGFATVACKVLDLNDRSFDLIGDIKFYRIRATV